MNKNVLNVNEGFERQVYTLFKYIVLAGFIITAFMSCSRNDLLEHRISEMRLIDTINNEQFTLLKEFIESNHEERSFKKFFSSTQSVDNDKLISYLENKGFVIFSEQPQKHISKINFYLESSGSMDGYLNGSTGYKNHIIDLLVDVKSKYPVKDINLSYITNKVTPLNISDDVYDITNALTIKSFRTAGNRGNSDLNEMLNMSFNLQDDREVTFLVSDMIYSLKGQEVLDLLIANKSFVKDAFNKALKKDTDLSTLILKLDSEFTGTYYSYNNKRTVLKNESRPYYIFVFGGEKYLNEVIEKLDLLNRDEVEEYHYFSPSQQKVYYSVFKSRLDIGAYSLNNRRNKDEVSISNIRVSGRNETAFRFTLGADFSKLNLEDTYLKNIENYVITQGRYELVAVEEFDSDLLYATAKEQLSRSRHSLTHLLIFEAKNSNYTDLAFSLKKEIPEWVNEVNTENDLDIKETLDKTFGFKYLFNGIYESYLNNTGATNYSEFKLEINK
ncbi:hypothetical protein VSO92_08095 [Myroides pelagicus]|uniref:hypothetical protein n=1 Tax=Myroides pelagicus TaxID=270914 RepID=UPI002DBA488D|nr:hypothetical protein [Myroides pelagicus]MEC4114065.1 hypothetical protein [Myroides pelagicus]